MPVTLDRRRRDTRTLDGLVRAGILRPAVPSASSGTVSYSTGRDFSAAGSTNLRFTTFPGGLQTACTIAMRFVPTYAGNDAAAHGLLELYTDTNNKIIAWKNTDNKFYISIKQTATTNLTSAAQSFAAGTACRYVGRVTANGAQALNFNGTDAAPTTNVLTPSAPVTMYVGLTVGANSDSSVGPVLVSPSHKSDAWTTSIQADSGSAYSEPARLVRDYMAAGDMIIPLLGDSTGYVKVA